MHIKPTQDYVAILKPEERKETESGILLSKDVKEKPSKGIISHTWPDCKLKEGMTVFFTKYSPEQIELDDWTIYLIIKESSILAVQHD